MANNYTHNPWIIDTAGSSSITADTIRIKGIRWVGATTAGHQAILKDSLGQVIWASVASGANYVEADHLYNRPGLNYLGLAVTTLQSGTIYIDFI